MKVTLDLPREAEGRVTKTGEGSITIEPRFRKLDCNQTLLYATVRGDKGAVRRFTIQVNGGSGQMICQEARDVPASFDKPDRPDTPPSPEKDGKAEEARLSIRDIQDEESRL